MATWRGRAGGKIHLALHAIRLGSDPRGAGDAGFRVEEGLDPQLARSLFDDDNFGFATLWVFLADFLLATGIAALRDGSLPRWLGWFALGTSLTLLVARFFWDGPAGLVFLPYSLTGLWILIASIYLIRAAGKAGASAV